MKIPIKQHLSITKKEWNGLVILVILIAGVLLAPYGYRWFRKDNTINFKDFDKAAAQLDRAKNNGYYADSSAGSFDKISHPVMFPFDPNILTAAQWKLLGLSTAQANVILHYRAKGGHFYKKEDVKKKLSFTLLALKKRMSKEMYHELVEEEMINIDGLPRQIKTLISHAEKHVAPIFKVFI